MIFLILKCNFFQSLHFQNKGLFSAFGIITRKQVRVSSAAAGCHAHLNIKRCHIICKVRSI